MTTEELAALFDKHSDEYLEFDRVPIKRSQRPDLHAMLVIDDLCPGDKDIISAAEHDEFWLSVSVEEFAAVATEDIVIELTRCGLRYDNYCEALGFFA